VNWVRVEKGHFTKTVKQNLLSGRVLMIMSKVSDEIIGQKCGFRSGVLVAEGGDSLQRDKAHLRDVIFSQRYRRRFKSSGEWRLSISTE